MKLSRTLIAIAGITLFLTACDQDSATDSIAVKANTNPLLAYVPADTAYVFAALESAPAEVTDAYLARVQPVLDVLSTQAARFKADFATGEYDGNEMATLAATVLDELGGNISSGGLAKLGISLQAHQVIYGMGVFPVIRFELSDAQAFTDAIGRIEAKIGHELPAKELNGNSYWTLSEDDNWAGLYIAILDTQLAISVFPANAEDTLLPLFLGQDMPAQSMASSNALAVMNRQKGYTGYGSGMLDLQKLADELLLPDSATHTYLGSDSQIDLAAYDAVCIAETRAMIATTPRMTAGVVKLTSNEIAMRYELEIETSLASALRGLASAIPIAETGEQLLSASLAVRIGQLRKFLLAKSNAIVADPYECTLFDDLNDAAAQLVQQLNIPMPPMVNNLLGARISVKDFNPDADNPLQKGLVAIHVENPEMFVGMASMLVPGFNNLDLANQKEPVKIPAELLHIDIDDFDVYALLGDDAIGVAIGEQDTAGLLRFMSAESQDKGVFLSVAYDSARFMERHPELLDHLGEHTGGSKDQNEFEQEFATALKTTAMSMLGTTRWELRFGEDGLVIDNNMTFR